MKRSFSEYFKHEFETDFEVDSRRRLNRAGQVQGIDVSGMDPEMGLSEAEMETGYSLIRELKPNVLRIPDADNERERWLEFAKTQMISPHLVISCEMDLTEAEHLAVDCLRRFGNSDVWSPSRFYEISADLYALSDEAKAEDVLSKTRKLAEIIKKTDPEGMIIIGGMFPNASRWGQAKAVNQKLLENCGDVMDLFGVQVFPEPLNGKDWEDEKDGIEVNCRLAEEIGKTLVRLKNHISQVTGEDRINIAVNGWSFLRDDVRQKKQDGLYYISVQNTLQKYAAWIPLAEAGPLFGNGGLLRREDGVVFGDVFYHSLLLSVPALPVPLEIHEKDDGKKNPVYQWPGLPGSIEGGEIKMVEASAAMSGDGKRLYLLVTNRSPYRRAVLHVRFRGFDKMHPAEAFVLSSKKRLDENDAGNPTRVYCKAVKLRNYRKMDHVNLDIPQCSAVCMLLD